MTYVLSVLVHIVMYLAFLLVGYLATGAALDGDWRNAAVQGCIAMGILALELAFTWVVDREDDDESN